MVVRFIRRRRNNLPGLTILEANDNFPTKDSSSVFVHFLRFFHNDNKSMMSLYLVISTYMVKFVELIPIPRNIIDVRGPDILSAANGIPMSWNA